MQRIKNVLFICKKNYGYGEKYSSRSGLYNSTKFIVDMLNQNSTNAKLVEVIDNNEIDREVTAFDPDIVVIEALWVVPDKFDILKKLHPSVEWHVHLHSNAPFLAMEGIGIEWISNYAKKNVGIIVNSESAYEALSAILATGQIKLLQNVYQGLAISNKLQHKNYVNIGCFGAIRPMKNQLTQALAAIKFAEQKNATLNFFINSTRSETGGDPVLKNIRALFHNGKHILVEIPWLDHAAFLTFLPQMDIAMQVSLSETFNVVTADCVTSGVPVVTSSEVNWVSNGCHAPTDSVDGIVAVMHKVYLDHNLVSRNQKYLSAYCNNSIKQWLTFING